MKANLRAKKNQACLRQRASQGSKVSPSRPQRAVRRLIVTIAATVSSVAMGGMVLLLTNAAFSAAFAQDADRLCSLSGVPLSSATTRRLIEQETPCPLPSFTFQDAQGQPLTLERFAGKVILVNLWATWCPPCLKEMPSLDRLQQTHGSERFAVVAISQDRQANAGAAWLKAQGLTALDVYADPQAAAGKTLKSPGLPVSLLLDEQGRELARLYGSAEWDSPQMVEALKRLAPQGFTP